MSEPVKAELIEEARQLMGFPRPNADILVALLCAWDMGLRRPASLADMAMKMMPSCTVSRPSRGAL